MPKLETQAAGQYRFEASGRDWRGEGELDESTVEGARFGEGTLLGIASRNRALSYSASGHVGWLTRAALPRRQCRMADDDRFNGSLTGTFTFEGSGRTTDDLSLRTTASLVDSTLAGARFPSAAVEFQMAIGDHANCGPLRSFPAVCHAKTRADRYGAERFSDMSVALALPKAGPVELLEASGTKR